MLLLCIPLAIKADNEINLTPAPMKMTKGTGELTIPQNFTIATGEISEENAAEAQKFATLFTHVTGYTVDVKKESADALVTMAMYSGNEELGLEGYTLDVTANGIAITANSPNGFYYAFQSIKKMLPANVMAEVKDNKVTEYTLPVVSIVDAPRFEYRGFMLDVSRHFFELDEIKLIIDVM